MNTENPERSQTVDDVEPMPQPTYAPVAMAMGITMLAWGIQTHWSMSLAGAVLMAWALCTWIVQICREWRPADEA